jgi:uncharacterized protein (UPF0332 family)
MDWRDLASEHFLSAQILLLNGHWRSAISRAYYATYCGVTWKALQRGPITFSSGYQNPSHEAIPGLIRNKCVSPGPQADALIESCTLLRYFRIDADYKPHSAVDGAIARDVIREASLVLSALGV